MNLSSDTRSSRIRLFLLLKARFFPIMVPKLANELAIKSLRSSMKYQLRLEQTAMIIKLIKPISLVLRLMNRGELRIGLESLIHAFHCPHSVQFIGAIDHIRRNGDAKELRG